MPDIEIGQRISLDETVIDTGDGAEDSDSDIEQPETTEVQIEEHVKASIKESSVRAQVSYSRPALWLGATGCVNDSVF